MESNNHNLSDQDSQKLNNSKRLSDPVSSQDVNDQTKVNEFNENLNSQKMQAAGLVDVPPVKESEEVLIPVVSASSPESSPLEAHLEKMKHLQNELKEKENRYLYLYAEFDNYKRRSIKERSDLIKFGWESVARDLLQIVDNLERAVMHLPTDTDVAFSNGLTMIVDQFKTTLHKQGVQSIASLEKPFDPNLHEAIGQEVSTLPSGTIIKEHTSGYTLHGRLLRPARVVISQGPSS